MANELHIDHLNIQVKGLTPHMTQSMAVNLETSLGNALREYLKARRLSNTGTANLDAGVVRSATPGGDISLADQVARRVVETIDQGDGKHG